jgi:hypothetical protein
MKLSLYLLLGGLLLPQFSQLASAQCSAGNITCVGSDCTIENGVEYAFGDSTNGANFGSFKTDTYTDGYANGLVTSKSGFARVGNDSIKHQIWGPDATGESGKRAELSDVSYNHPRSDANGIAYYYWYGWSYWIPNDSNWSSPTLQQYIGQWRWSNTLGCITQKYCDGSILGGSGHHLLYEGGKLSFDMEIPDTACSTSGRLKLLKTDLGTLSKGVWVDFIMQAKWISNSTGSVKIWIQNNGGGYTNKMNYSGPTWVGKYNAVSTCPYNGQNTGAPNWQVGMYYSNDKPSVSNPRGMFSDELKMQRTICPDTTNSEGWKSVFR